MAGDWYLFVGDGVPKPDEIALFTLRAGKVLESGAAIEVGTYEATQGLVEVAIGDGRFVGRQVDPANPTLSGTFVGEGGDGLSEPALLLRAKAQPATH